MFKQFAAGAILAAAAVTSSAAPTSFYAGLDVGSTKIDDISDSKTSAGAFVGYGFNPYVAVELGYRQAGKFEVIGGDLTTKETHLSVVGSFPLNQQFDIYGRLGHNFAKSEVDTRNGSYDNDMDGGLVGIGVRAGFGANLSGRFEVQQTARDATNVGINIVYKF